MQAIKKSAKSAVRYFETILPKPIFDSGWKFLYAAYKLYGRIKYRLKALLIYTPFNREKWEMARRVSHVLPYTLVGIKGLEATYKLCQAMNAHEIPGDFVELGVARGGCAALIGSTIFASSHSKSSGRSLWLFDSYEGLPDPTAQDFDLAHGSGTGDHVQSLTRGSCLGTLEDVRHLLLDVEKFPQDRVHFVKGWFEDTVPATRKRIGKIAVLRIDGDWYESTKSCLEGLYEQVSTGGAIIIDDYESCYGCRKATDEFVSGSQLSVNVTLDGRGGCFFIKT